MIDPAQRFSSRVEQYVKSRPHYPPEFIRTLEEHCGLTKESVVADIGSGTGILTEEFLKNGNRVFGVEPNREMREAAERLLHAYPLFRSVDGRAESTTLPARSVNFVAAGQAFHWFDRDRAREEFSRILKPDGWVVLLWNERLTGPAPFLREYEELVKRYATDYAEVDHRKIDRPVLKEFFGGEEIGSGTFHQSQLFDLAGAESRLLSSSYMPGPGHASYEPMLASLGRIFRANERNGSVAFEYLTLLYYGRLGAKTATSS
ncbi:MAG TPA: class I SAM-dependent methyltransferase [Bacteroidota bacterium]